jgi:hypothetical protein
MLNFNVARNLVAAAFKPTRAMELARNGRAQRVESALAATADSHYSRRTGGCGCGGFREISSLGDKLRSSFREEAHIPQNIHSAPIGPNE